MSSSLEPKEHLTIPVDGLELELCRFGLENGPPVLLLHGASASRDTFLVPNGGLVAYLGEHFDVWTLDWRGSRRVVEKLLERPPSRSRDDECRELTIDRVAEEDVPKALRIVREHTGGKPISVVAHCVGAGAFSVAIARDQTAGVRNVVLTALGLFYEVPWDGWIKAEDFVLERILAHAPECRAIDPRKPDQWPADMAEAYAAFPAAWLPQGDETADALLRRLTFMFGQPYPKEVLAPDIHGPNLSELFGPMHLGLYLHAAQMVRRGYAAPFDELDVIDRSRLAGLRQRSPARSDLTPGPFGEKRITLITGAENRLWHRDSIDLMYEWLLAEAPPTGGGRRPVKRVLPGYAHQDLYWGRNATHEVYPIILEGLR